MLIQTGKPDEAEVVTDQVKLVVLHYTGNAGSIGHRQGCQAAAVTRECHFFIILK